MPAPRLDTTTKRRRRASSWALDPRYCPADASSFCDAPRSFNLAYVVTDAPLSSEVTPIEPVVSEVEWQRAMADDATLELVGFGATSTNEQGGGGRNVASTQRHIAERDGQFAVGDPRARFAPGDNGGPALVRTDDGALHLVGVLSHLTPRSQGGSWYQAAYRSLCWIEEDSGIDLAAVPNDGSWDCESPRGGPAGGCNVTGRSGGPGFWLLVALGLPMLSRRRGAE